MGSLTKTGQPDRATADLALLALALVIVAGLRLPWVGELVINHDESMFFVVAQDLVAGGTPYVTASGDCAFHTLRW